MEPIKTAKGRRIRYRLPRPLDKAELEWARKQARKAGLSLTTWLRRVSQTFSDKDSDGTDPEDSRKA